MSDRRSMPPLRSTLKAKEVEDPVNVWLHRPIAYGVAWLLFRTPVTANTVTFFAMVVGVIAGAFFLHGAPSSMIVGGILLWASAILDGVDGILARAKGEQSRFGRALDGTADSVVAVCTVFPAFFHIWRTNHDLIQLAVMGPALLLTLAHLYAYDYFKEAFLRHVRPDVPSEDGDRESVARLVDQAKDKGLVTRFAVRRVLLPYVGAQEKLVGILVPAARRDGPGTSRSSASIYRRYNEGPMRLWAMISLAPHSYLMAICAMAGRLDVYLWIRLVAMNAIFAVAVVWQRRATERTNEALMARTSDGARDAPAFIGAEASHRRGR